MPQAPQPPSVPPRQPSRQDRIRQSRRRQGGLRRRRRELRVLAEESPVQSPLDSSFDISHISSTETSPFATPAREALSALRHTAKAAAEAGAPFSERALKEAEALVRSAEERAVASVSGGNTPKAVKLHLPPVDEADEAAGRDLEYPRRRRRRRRRQRRRPQREAETEATRAREKTRRKPPHDRWHSCDRRIPPGAMRRRSRR